MSSGFAISEDIMTTYNSLKLEKNKGPRYFTMLLDIEKSAVILGDVGLRTDCCETDLVTCGNNLPTDLPRYVCFDMEFTNAEGQVRKKPVFISWCPDKCSTKKKMLTASSCDALKKKFEGLGAVIHATDHEDIAFASITSRIKKF